MCTEINSGIFFQYIFSFNKYYEKYILKYFRDITSRTFFPSLEISLPPSPSLIRHQINGVERCHLRWSERWEHKQNEQQQEELARAAEPQFGDDDDECSGGACKI